MNLLEQFTNYAMWFDGPILYWMHNRPAEKKKQQQFTKLLSTNGNYFYRTCFPAHFTASALVVTADFQRVLLALHAKLGAWLQLGGHLDGSSNLAECALREAREESGLEALTFVDFACSLTSGGSFKGTIPFDLDAHHIPAFGNEPQHTHFDVMYLLTADEDAPLIKSSESLELQWFSIEEARLLTREKTLHRVMSKVEGLQ